MNGIAVNLDSSLEVVLVALCDGEGLVLEHVKLKAEHKTHTFTAATAIELHRRTNAYQLQLNHNGTDVAAFRRPELKQFSYPNNPRITTQCKTKLSTLPVTLTFIVDGWTDEARIHLCEISILGKSKSA